MRVYNFNNLDTIELKEGLSAQYLPGKGIDEHPDTLPYKIKFISGIPTNAVTWCVENCKENWGWLFINIDLKKPIPQCELSYLLFKSENDAILFKLQYRF